MTQHASEDPRNVERTVLVALAAQASGWVVAPDGDEKFLTASVDRFIRPTFLYPTPSATGRIIDSSTRFRASRMPVMAMIEVYARGSAAGEGSTVDDVVGMAGKVAHTLAYADFPLKDYVTDPTGSTTIAGACVRFPGPAEIQRLPPDDGWQRRIVQSTGHWFARHAES